VNALGCELGADYVDKRHQACHGGAHPVCQRRYIGPALNAEWTFEKEFAAYFDVRFVLIAERREIGPRSIFQ
jgi:hypothetical protein